GRAYIEFKRDIFPSISEFATFSAACEAVPFQNRNLIRDSLTAKCQLPSAGGQVPTASSDTMNPSANNLRRRAF
ncbi:MAG: hypothetical protein WA655_02590, partial [Candidatus Korobacteraceae bacterium]